MSFTKSEFRETAIEVFDELLPTLKSGARNRLISELISELQERGLDIDEDFSDEDEEGEDEGED